MFWKEIIVTLFLISPIFSQADKEDAVLENSYGSRIVGGKVVDIKDFPFMVSLHYKGSGRCGGSIISSTFVLTAGHCIDHDPKYVRAGSSFFNDSGTVHKIKHFVRSKRGDIGLLQLEDPISYDDTRQPIELFNENEPIPYGQLANVTGWGLLNYYGKPTFSDQLRLVSVPLVDQTTCNQAYNVIKTNEVKDDEFCAGYLGTGDKDACGGDSGGPLFVNHRQVGVVSRGYACALPDFPGIYVSVPHFKKWIDEVLSEAGEKAEAGSAIPEVTTESDEDFSIDPRIQ